MAESPFKLLFSPLKVGKLTLRNRIVFLPHTNYFPIGDLPGERELYYFGERAKGGVGLIIYGGQFVHRVGGGPFVDVTDPKIVERYKRITDKVHEHGAFISAQLVHAGATQFFSESGLEWTMPYGPSPMRAAGAITREMDHDDLQRTIEAYVRAARRVVEGGFDGIEVRLNAGLLQDFTSGITNRRSDEYGGSVENRLRLPLEIIKAVREEAGPNIVMDTRICVEEVTPGGYGIEEGQEIARLIEACGHIDFINTAIGWASSPDIQGTYPIPLGFGIEPAAAVKRVVDIPVVAQGRINEPAQAEAVLAEGKGDLIGMARGLIADPEFPNKAREGRSDDIRKCFAYHDVCQDRNTRRFPISCIWNPSAGREKQLGIGTLQQAGEKKRVLIVGGGPAGMKVAEIAASRGHLVTLCDKADQLGGQINLAIRLPFRDHMGEIPSFLSYQLEKLGVDIRKKTEVTPEMIIAADADVVVVATGSVPFIPEIPGVRQQNVVTYWDVAQDRGVKGQRVLVYDTVGHWAGGSIVELLANQGKRVYVVTPHRNVLSQIVSRTLPLWEQRVSGKDIVSITEANVTGIRDGTATLASSVAATEMEAIKGIDTVVLICGATPNDSLYQALKGKVKDVKMVGDCEVPLRIERAIYSAELLARAL